MRTNGESYALSVGEQQVLSVAPPSRDVTLNCSDPEVDAACYCSDPEVAGGRHVGG